MARGFLNGAFWGSSASICALGVISVLSEVPDAPNAVVAVAPALNETQQPVETVKTEESVVVQSPEAHIPPAGQQTTAPEPDTLAAVQSESTTPAALPETGTAPAFSDPQIETALPDIETAARETPVAPSVPLASLQAPGTAAPSISVSTDPAQPVSPEVNNEIASTVNPVQPIAPVGEENSSSFGGDSPEEPGTPPAVALSISEEPDQPQIPAVPVETQAFQTPTSEADATNLSQPHAAIAPKGKVFARVDKAPVPDTYSAQPATDVPLEAGALRGTQPAEGVLSNPADVTVNRGGEVRVNRLATLGGEGKLETVVPNAKSLRPVEQFATAFENKEGKPVMAIVLMDDGVNLAQGGIGLLALRSFPYPISFAVDTSLPDAKTRMATYRTEGFEVLAMVDLPQGALAHDAEVTLAVALEAVPEAVGVLEGVQGGVQGSRDAALQVADILAKTGHGFVTQNNGLNTVQKLAAKSGVPSAVVFRDFDSAEQTPTVIRRFLDQAAFKASNEGDVIILGRLREETISALLIWGLQDRARSVALAPISAALKSQ